MAQIDYGTNETWAWNGSTLAVEFWIYVGGKPVKCRVSKECIRDHLGNPETAEGCLDTAKARFDSITDKVGFLIAAGRFEEDGSIVLHSADW